MRANGLCAQLRAGDDPSNHATLMNLTQQLRAQVGSDGAKRLSDVIVAHPALAADRRPSMTRGYTVRPVQSGNWLA